MYIDPITPEETQKFLTGFGVGCCACGAELDLQTVGERRGWQLSTSFVEEMQSKGLTAQEMCDELIDIYMEALTNNAS